jgi:cystathionine beta-lyase
VLLSKSVSSEPGSSESGSRAALFARWDAITPDQLHAAGSMKWSLFPGTIGAWVAESDLGTAPAVTTALHSAINAGQLGYLPRYVAAEMGRATAEWMRDRFDWKVDETRIYPLPDVITGLVVAMNTFSRPGSAVIVPTPAYMPFLTVPAVHGRTAIEVPMASSGGRTVLDLGAIER